MGKKVNKDFDRGRIETIKLKRPITLNENLIKSAVVEIDHINFGLDKKTEKLNLKRRSNFSLSDIECFLQMLDGEYILPKKYDGLVTKFEFRINCPIKGRFFNKEFILIFSLNYKKQDEIYTITLFPGW